MADILTRLGLQSNSSSTPTPNYAPHFIIANFVLAYLVFSTRGAKNRLGIDHNVSPREDVTKYGDEAFRKGKITQAQLSKLKRQEAAHANAVENFPLIVGALIFAQIARLPNDMVNRHALFYTITRIAFAICYAQTTTHAFSYVRTAFWMAANIACIRLLWFAGKAINA